jgi:hypothetical protein
MKTTVYNKQSTFNSLRAKLNKQLKENGNKRSSELLNELLHATPIDTGEARSGWTKIERPYGNDIINPVPHVEQLNQGSSQQAPQFFIEQVALKYGTPMGTIVEIK